MFLKRKFLLILFIGFLISSTTSFLHLTKHDGDGMGQNLIWLQAEKLSKDLKNGKNFFSSGGEYLRTYLASRLLGIYSYLTEYELFENSSESDFQKRQEATIPSLKGGYSDDTGKSNLWQVNQGYGNLLYLIIQTLIYYLALLFFYFKILKFFNFNKQKCFIILCFLALEPTIIQWHSSFWTESIFFSLQLISLGLIIKKNKNIFHYLIIGLFIGLLYLQKTVAMFYIFLVASYFFVSVKNKRIISIVSLFIGYLIVLLFLGYHNYKRSDIFYIIPEQAKLAHYLYMVPQALSKKNNISEKEVNRKKMESESKWIIENNLNMNSEIDRMKLYQYKQKYAFKVMLDNPLITAEIYAKKIIHHGLLNPVQVYYWYNYHTKDYSRREEYHKNVDHKKWIWKRILYSLIIYFFVIIGIFSSFKKKEYKNFNYFIILTVVYYILMLGWMGNTRYFMPSFILTSIFFGEGMFVIFQRLIRRIHQ